MQSPLLQGHGKKAKRSMLQRKIQAGKIKHCQYIATLPADKGIMIVCNVYNCALLMKQTTLLKNQN